MSSLEIETPVSVGGNNGKHGNGETEPFVPYETTSIDTPVLHFAVQPCVDFLNPFLRMFYKFRWAVSYPLGQRIFPKFVPACACIPVIGWIPYMTAGELLSLIPLVGVFVWGYITTFVNHDVSGSGTVASVPLVIAFLTASKSDSVFSFLLGVPFERMINWHLAWSLLSVCLGCFHYYVCYAFSSEDDEDRVRSLLLSSPSEDDVFASSNNMYSAMSDDAMHRDLSGDDSQYALYGPTPDFVKFSFDGGTNQSGTLLVLALIAIVSPALVPWIRRLFFELFYHSHVILALAIIVFGLMHGVGIMGLPLAFWVLDLVMRYVIMAYVRYPHKANIQLLPADVIQLSFPKPPEFEYNPGQFVQICIPALSFLQFHPFSLSSAPHQDMVTIHIRVLGNWTNRLKTLASKVEEVDMWMEGPYGSLSVDLDNAERYKMVLLLSGGIGITPMQSICNSLIHQHTQIGRPLKKLYFVWSVRDEDMVDALHDDEEGGTTIPGRHNLNKSVDRLGTTRFQPDLLERVNLVDSFRIPKTTAANKNNSKNSTDADDMVETVLKETNGTMDNFLHTEFYLTSKKAKDGMVPSPYIFMGRPNVPAIFAKMKKSALAQGESRVAVCVCGPSPLVSACREASRQQSGGGVTFDFHYETFEF
uniref:FAD-binding FR-type domain-containing protein n=1 Tax=Attheya septentrionalis TaxID=420275 RepID=A0A6T7H5I0_9STRA|mmetsp:Transcript_19320/g.35057  ORF Transcript_19320/g.35057 Transcript_19320/m.35057 type:complete len:645 (+) Transcript_19320:149-2083(+)